MHPSPWRITFDTNPDDCNLHCIMCEDHSPYSRSQQERIARGQPKRLMDIGVVRQVLNELASSPPREIIPSFAVLPGEPVEEAMSDLPALAARLACQPTALRGSVPLLHPTVNTNRRLLTLLRSPENALRELERSKGGTFGGWVPETSKDGFGIIRSHLYLCGRTT